MENTAPPKPIQHRVLFFGTHGNFSYAVLNYLINRGVNIIGLVIPGSKPTQALDTLNGIPIVQETAHATVENLALARHFPITYTDDPQTSQFGYEIEKLQPDYILVACFPYRLPSSVFQLPKVATLNIHPSLLPGYRGPQPLFWQLRNGELKMGVSLHLVNEELDAGDILLQTEVPLRPGMRGRAIESRLGEFGAKQFLEAMRLYQLNNINPQQQSWIKATYNPNPKYEDFEISTNWSARRAFMFMRGTEEWGRGYQIQVGDTMIVLKTAMAYSPSGRIDKPYELEDNYITIQFSPGLVNAFIESIN